MKNSKKTILSLLAAVASVISLPSCVTSGGYGYSSKGGIVPMGVSAPPIAVSLAYSQSDARSYGGGGYMPQPCAIPQQRGRMMPPPQMMPPQRGNYCPPPQRGRMPYPPQYGRQRPPRGPMPCPPNMMPPRQPNCPPGYRPAGGGYPPQYYGNNGYARPNWTGRNTGSWNPTGSMLPPYQTFR